MGSRIWLALQVGASMFLANVINPHMPKDLPGGPSVRYVAGSILAILIVTVASETALARPRFVCTWRKRSGRDIPGSEISLGPGESERYEMSVDLVGESWFGRCFVKLIKQGAQARVSLRNSDYVWCLVEEAEDGSGASGRVPRQVAVHTEDNAGVQFVLREVSRGGLNSTAEVTWEAAHESGQRSLELYCDLFYGKRQRRVPRILYNDGSKIRKIHKVGGDFG